MKTIDAKNKTLGRIASAAAKMLMGKDEPSYTPNIDSNVKVQIINASKVKIPQKKLREKIYTSYTGYSGGLKFQTLEEMINKKGYAEVFKTAVWGMIPKNSLKKNRMANLEIID